MKINYLKYLIFIPVILLPTACNGKTSSGFANIDYTINARDRYNNEFDNNQLPEQWENYGVGDPYILRFNGEYYLYSSTKDKEYGYKVWKSRNLINYEYLGKYQFLNSDESITGQDGQYAPEVYYWNGDFYCYGSPGGNGHYVYKSTTKLPYGDFKAVTGNLGLRIDGSVFIDDDESMTFLTSGDGTIHAYEMNSMESIVKSSDTELLSPLIKQTEGPFLMKHDDTYYLTYAGNHVKSAGYRIAYSYSETSPFSGYNYPSNNPIALKTSGDFVGLGHSSTVLGPNLDAYYLAYHNLTDQSGPKRALDISRIFFAKNRMYLYGPKKNENLVPLMPEYAEYDSSKLVSDGAMKLSNVKTGSSFTAEYNFSNINASSKLLFGVNDTASNYIEIDNQGIYLTVNNELIGNGTFNHNFDFTKVHSVRLAVSNGRYCVFFDNMKKIDVQGVSTIGGYIGYESVNNIGATIFSNDSFDSSSRTDFKSLPGTIYASNYLNESKLSKDAVYDIKEDDYDSDCLYTGGEAVKFNNPGEYALYLVDAEEDGLYGFDLSFSQKDKGSQFSIQIDNNEPCIFTLPSVDFSNNMNSYESDLQFIKAHVAEMEITKGLHTLKIELCKGSASVFYLNSFKESKYVPNYSNDLSTYVEKGANYMSLWKLVNDNGVNVHKAKAGANNMILFGDESLTDVEVEVEIKVDVSAAVNALAGVIVRCNNPSLYTSQVDQSAQGYFVGFNRLQLITQKINYDAVTVGVQTGDEYTLREWHKLKVIAKDNMIRVYFDDNEYQSFVDPDPFTHGSIALYSINSESNFKNLSIKGI